MPESNFGASSSNFIRPQTVAYFEKAELQYQHIDYNDPVSCIKCFAGIELLLFVSWTAVDEWKRRNKQHWNVIDVVRVKRVEYVGVLWR